MVRLNKSALLLKLKEETNHIRNNSIKSSKISPRTPQICFSGGLDSSGAHDANKVRWWCPAASSCWRTTTSFHPKRPKSSRWFLRHKLALPPPKVSSRPCPGSWSNLKSVDKESVSMWSLLGPSLQVEFYYRRTIPLREERSASCKCWPTDCSVTVPKTAPKYRLCTDRPSLGTNRRSRLRLGGKYPELDYQSVPTGTCELPWRQTNNVRGRTLAPPQGNSGSPRCSSRKRIECRNRWSSQSASNPTLFCNYWWQYSVGSWLQGENNQYFWLQQALSETNLVIWGSGKDFLDCPLHFGSEVGSRCFHVG